MTTEVPSDTTVKEKSRMQKKNIYICVTYGRAPSSDNQKLEGIMTRMFGPAENDGDEVDKYLEWFINNPEFNSKVMWLVENNDVNDLLHAHVLISITAAKIDVMLNEKKFMESMSREASPVEVHLYHAIVENKNEHVRKSMLLKRKFIERADEKWRVEKRSVSVDSKIVPPDSIALRKSSVNPLQSPHAQVIPLRRPSQRRPSPPLPPIPTTSCRCPTVTSPEFDESVDEEVDSETEETPEPLAPHRVELRSPPVQRVLPRRALVSNIRSQTAPPRVDVTPTRISYGGLRFTKAV